jgi:hypothetical protein
VCAGGGGGGCMWPSPSMRCGRQQGTALQALEASSPQPHTAGLGFCLARLAAGQAGGRSGGLRIAGAGRLLLACCSTCSSVHGQQKAAICPAHHPHLYA